MSLPCITPKFKLFWLVQMQNFNILPFLYIFIRVITFITNRKYALFRYPNPLDKKCTMYCYKWSWLAVRELSIISLIMNYFRLLCSPAMPLSDTHGRTDNIWLHAICPKIFLCPILLSIMLIFATHFIISISSKKRGSYNRHHRLSVVYTKEEQRFPELFGSMVKSCF